jgi:peptide/nickel transport system permease protein
VSTGQIAVVHRYRRLRVTRSGRALPLAATVAAVAIVLLAIVAIAAPWLAPYSPDQVNFAIPFAGSSAQHLLGTDSDGRDLFSRLLIGSRTSLLGPLIVVGISTPVGTIMALGAAWMGGVVDQVLSRVIDLLFAFPGLLLAIFASAVFGVGLRTCAIALSVSYVPYIARIVRSEALRQRNLPYIEASWAQGLPDRRIVRRHLLPSLYALLIAQTTVSFAYATIDIAALSYLGLGVQPPTADWGSMIAEGQTYIVPGHPQESLYAGICIILTVIAFTVVGDYVGSLAGRSDARH